MPARPQKTWRMEYWSDPDRQLQAQISILGDPDELRLGVGPKSFISLTESSMSMSGGTPSKFSVQGFAGNITYAGMLKSPGWPLSMIPSTVATPIPQQTFKPPFVEELPFWTEVAGLLTNLV